MQRSDVDALIDQHQFVRDDGEDTKTFSQDWRTRMARRYYDQLYKEFAIIDLSRSCEGMVGLRWRTKEEVLGGRGQLFCGAKRCETTEGLVTLELPFQYCEHGEEKMELVKIKLCIKCADKLMQYKEMSKQKSKRPYVDEPQHGKKKIEKRKKNE
jgi:hypothetical protein